MPSYASSASSPTPQSCSDGDDEFNVPGAIARRYGSSPVLIQPYNPNGSGNHEGYSNHNGTPHSTPPATSRRTSPLLSSRSVLSPSGLLSTRGLLIVLCLLHTIVVVCVLLWLFSTSSSSSSSSFASSSAADASPFGTWDALLSKVDVKSLRYSSPVSILPLSSTNADVAADTSLLSSALPSATAAEASDTSNQQQTENSNAAPAKVEEATTLASSPAAVTTSAVYTSAMSKQVQSNDAVILPLPAALGVSVTAFVNHLQHEQCTDSSSTPPTLSAPVRSLIYSCLANAVRLEHDDELYQQHSIAGLYAILRAATLATASNRTMLIDHSQCGDIQSLPEGVARDAGLLCCSWQSLFQPLSSCAMPEGAVSQSTSSNVRAWSVAAVVQYDAAQECMWEEETWTAMKALFPDVSRHSAVRSIAAQLFRPSTQLASALSTLSSSLPASALTLHIPPFSISSDRANNYTFASAIPLRIYVNTARMHSLTIGQTSLALLATPEELVHVQSSLPHLVVLDVWSLAEKAVADVAKDMQWAAVQASVVFWAASRPDWWLGVHQSLLTQLVASMAGNVSVLDVSGDRWMSSCWSASPHSLSAEIALPRPYNLPALSSLASDNKDTTVRTPLVLVLGSAGVGVPLLDAVLTDSRVGFVKNDVLSKSYSQLFKARDYTVPAYHDNRVSFIHELRAAFTSATPNSRGILLQFERDEKSGRERALTHYHHASFLAQIVNNYQLPLSVHVLVVARDPAATLRSLLSGSSIATGAGGQTRVLGESRLLRDVIYGLEAETAAMDLSVYRVFNHERLWRSGTAKEAARIAEFLQLPADVQQQLVETLSGAAKNNTGKNFPPEPTWLALEDEAVEDTYSSMYALQLYNHDHAAHRATTHDYHKSFAAALVTAKRPSSLSSFAEQLAVFQGGDCSGQLLLFNGFTNWSSTSTRASSQVLDVLRSFTLALATGRTLVVPQLAGTVLGRLESVSACNWQTAASGWQIERKDDLWTLTHPDAALATDALSIDSVVMTHSPVVDLAYLAAWNREHADRALGVHQFIRSLLVHLLRPLADVDVTASTAQLQISLPQIISQPASFYVDAITASLSSDAYSSVHLTAAPTSFAQQSIPSFLPHANSSLLQSIADSLREETQVAITIESTASVAAVDAQLAELLHALDGSSAVLGSLGTEHGFVLASLIAPQRYSDFFGYQYLPSLLALNQYTLLHGQSTEVTEPYAPKAYRSNLVTKGQYSEKCRFVFIAGVEGTGHHGIGHLLTSLRTPRTHGVPLYKQLDADEHLSQFIWKMFGHQSYTFHNRVKKQLAVRLAWRVQQAARNAVAGEPAVVVINAIRENEGGMQSYPNTDFDDKTILHPSLPLLAQVFEANNADLRIITLTRNAGSSLASTIKRDHAVVVVGKSYAFYYQARVLRTNLAALSADMAALDPAFVTSISMEMIHQQPERVGKQLAAMMSYPEDEMTQACVRMREEVYMAPSNHWRLSMNISELQLADDMIGVGAYLPLTEGFRFLQVGNVGGGDVREERTCRRRTIRPRTDSKDAAILAIQGGGAGYLERVVEESTGVLGNTHVFDRVLPPSTRFALPSLLANSLTAFSLTELPLANPVPLFDFVPRLILVRNPLDIALSVALPELVKHAGLSHGKLHDLMSWRGVLWRNTNMGPLVSQMTTILKRVAEQYVNWVTVWKVAERRKAMLVGQVGDGVVVLRLEDLVGGGVQQLTDLLGFLQLPADNASVVCLEEAVDAMRHPPRLLSPVLVNRTASNNVKLSPLYSTLQEQLLLSSYPSQGTGSLPVGFIQLITQDAFKHFRAVVDEAATAIEGTDWARYVAEVQVALEAQWALNKIAAASGKKNAAAAAAAALKAGAIPPPTNPRTSPPNRGSNTQPVPVQAQTLDDQLLLATRELENQKRKLGAAFDTSREALKAKQRLAQLQALVQRRKQGKV